MKSLKSYDPTSLVRGRCLLQADFFRIQISAMTDKCYHL